MFEDVFEELPWHLAEQQAQALAEAEAKPQMTVMNMIEALNSAHDVMMARDADIVVIGEDVGYFGGVFRVTAGLQKKYGTQPRVRHADRRGRHRRRRDRHGALRPSPGRRDPVRRLYLSRASTRSSPRPAASATAPPANGRCRW